MGRFQENPDGSGKSPHIQHLRPHHRSMVRAVALGDFTPMELSQRFAMTPGQVSRIMGSPIFQAEVLRLQEEAEIITLDMAKDLKMMGELALQNLDEDLHIKPETLEARKYRGQVSTDILGMLGLSKTAGNNNTVINKILQVNQTINNNSKEVEEMDEQEIRDELLELTQTDDGAYE